MPLSFANGRMVITDTDGHVVFDSDEGLFHAISLHSGSITLPTRQARYRFSDLDEPVNIDIDHLLASGIHPEADTVVGSVKATSTTPHGIARFSGWFNASGTIMYYNDSTTFSRAQPPNNIACYTFKARGGQLVLNERVLIRANDTSGLTVTISLLSVTFDYKLFCGRFV